jgi:O-antigen/teichoic acid export membrane protein
LAVAETLRALAASCGTFVLAAGKPTHLSRIKLLEVACFGVLIVPLTMRWGLVGAASCLVVVYSLTLGGYVYAAQRAAPVTARLWRGSWEPTAVTLTLALSARFLSPRGDLAAVLCILLWVTVWTAYAWGRYAGLIWKVWTAVQGNRPPDQSVERLRV